MMPGSLTDLFFLFFFSLNPGSEALGLMETLLMTMMSLYLFIF